jgi:gamma-butyrobetaine dioxygenase
VVGDIDVAPLWLRDACSCAECRDEFSGQRLRGVLTLDADTEIASWRDDGDDIEVTFTPDGHVSRFSRSWLMANAPGKADVFDDRSERDRPPWLAADLGGCPPEITWPELQAGDQRATALRALMRTGILLVHDVPTELDMVLAVARSFAHVRTTNYGDLFDVRVEAQPVNLAFTGRAIAPHTDNPYREPVPGIQLLHCLQASSGGGDNLFIDGFAAAAIVRDEDPHAFATLSSTQLTFKYEDVDTLLRASGPIVSVNSAGDIRAIRWNDRSIQPPAVAPLDVAEVYRAMRVFAGILDRPELHLELKLEPGDCIVFDNTRVLHARTAFEGGSGARHLQGCYADLDGLASTVAVLERDALGTIERAFHSAAGMAYLGEKVTMIQHQLQAAALAVGCSDALVVAALLHDIGHVIDGETDAAGAMADDRDAHHDGLGARWLSRWFGPEVTEPVRLHVAAKRYLVATEPDYVAKLSPASVHTLRLQGGPMSPHEVRDFEALDHANDAVTLRRLDEAAKDASKDAPGFDTYRQLLHCVLRRAPATMPP